ncbi:MAG TPA: 2-dehydropantoate 2-reductase [Candidatus Thalassarchaeaceae archaeon]|nr:MAG TPA: 2-dehydropantoate 2-reductase [Candidatus Poseidoniales archaeon]HIH82741.1 2-dehydropantoate 2-reductase [Candidatus Thalassarchaeaceae archaeon]
MRDCGGLILRIAILGVGSIGSLIAAQLAKTDADLLLYTRGANGEVLATNGLLFTNLDGEIEHFPADRWVVFEGEIPEPLFSCVDVAIICGKSNSTATLAAVAEEMMRPNAIAISVQNGLGHSERLVGRLGRHRVLAGCTTHGAMRGGYGEVTWTGRGAIRMASLFESELGPGDSRVMDLIDILDDAGLDPEWEFDADEMLWHKLLLNVAINPLAAICGVRNGELLAQPELHEQAFSAMLEAAQVASAEGVDLSDFDCLAELNRVLEATAANRCSMLQDVMAGRVTEIDSLCGEVVRRGEEYGIATPLTQQLLTLVKGIEHSTNTG